MAKFRLVHTSFWNDPTVSEEMTPEDKYFFLYLLTNENTTQIGIYGITRRQIAFDLGYSIESVNALVQRFMDHHKLIKYNTKTREIAIKNWGKYNLNRGGKPVLDCVKSELKEVKDLSLIPYVAENIRNESIKSLYDTHYDTYSESCDDTSNDENDDEPKELNVNSGTPSYDTSTIRTTISGQEEEEEEEEDKEKEQEKEREEEQSSSVSHSLIDVRFVKIRTYFDEHIRLSTFAEHRKMNELLDDYNDPSLIIEAIKLSIERGAPHLNYVTGILKNWRKEHGILTYEDWKVKQYAKSQRHNKREQRTTLNTFGVDVGF